jgi:predicted RND superfamily exporter protein
MDYKQTLDFFIEKLEGDLDSISLEIREEKNYDDEVHKQMMDHLSEEWDEMNEHLQNLRQITDLLIAWDEIDT